MKVKDYKIYIESSSPEVREEKTLSGGFAFIGVDGENYSYTFKTTILIIGFGLVYILMECQPC